MDLSEIKNKELNTKQKIEDLLKTNPLVLVNSEFIKSFGTTSPLKEIEYNLYENTIELNLGSNESLQYKVKDNIIDLQNSNVNANEKKVEKQITSGNQNNEKSTELKTIVGKLPGLCL